MPKVSIITPTYKRDIPSVRRCIGSVKIQTLTDWEQFVCSDGDKEEEGVKNLILSVHDTRLKYCCLGRPKKPEDYGNTIRWEMLMKARGEYAMFLDDDNYIFPDFLEKMAKALDENKDAGFVICRTLYFFGSRTDYYSPKILMGTPKAGEIDPIQVMVRREAMLKNGWDVDGGYNADGYTLERLGKNNKHVRIEEMLSCHT